MPVHDRRDLVQRLGQVGGVGAADGRQRVARPRRRRLRTGVDRLGGDVAGRAAAVAVAEHPDPLADLRHPEAAEGHRVRRREVDGVVAVVWAAVATKFSTSVQRTQPAASSTSSTTVPGSTGRWLSG